MKTLFLSMVMLISFLSIAQTNERPFIEVTGESFVTVVPNYALLKVRIEANAKTASEAKKKHDLSVDAVLKFLKKQKIESKDIATHYVNLNKLYDYNTKEYSFVANQSIQITLKDLSKYDTVLNGLFEQGVNNLDGIHFASTDEGKHKSMARNLAMQNAKEKATEYAAAVNQNVGKAFVISEFQQNSGTRFESKMMMAEAAITGFERETIALGEIKIVAKVNVTFELN